MAHTGHQNVWEPMFGSYLMHIFRPRADVGEPMLHNFRTRAELDEMARSLEVFGPTVLSLEMRIGQSAS